MLKIVSKLALSSISWIKERPTYDNYDYYLDSAGTPTQQLLLQRRIYICTKFTSAKVITSKHNPKLDWNLSDTIGWWKICNIFCWFYVKYLKQLKQ